MWNVAAKQQGRHISTGFFAVPTIWDHPGAMKLREKGLCGVHLKAESYAHHLEKVVHGEDVT